MTIDTNLQIKNNTPRLDFIDALRGIAILGVIMIHIFGVLRAFGPHIASFVDWGSSGVKLFFIISSFTIFLSLKNRKEESFRGYFIRRFFRIAPLFYIVLITSTLFFAILHNVELNNFLAKIFFIDNFYPGWVNNQIIGVEWTIGVEMIFYLLVPFLFLNIKKLSTALIFLFITFCIPIFISLSGVYPATPQWQLYKAFSILSHLYIFAFGIVVYFLQEYFQTLKEGQKKIISNTCLFMLSTLLLLDFMGIEDRSKVIGIIFNLNLQFILYFSLLFFASTKSFLRFLWVNPLTIHMGKISYSAYLLHLMTYTLTINIFTNLDNLSVAIISFLLVILFSSITYRYIEKPFIKKGNLVANKYT